MGCGNQKQSSSFKSSKYSMPLSAKPFIEEADQIIREYNKIEQKLNKIRVILHQFQLSRQNHQKLLEDFNNFSTLSISKQTNSWKNCTYIEDMASIRTLEEQFLKQPDHFQELLDKIEKISRNFARIVSALNSTKQAHRKLLSMAEKYGLQDQNNLDKIICNLKKEEDKFINYFEKSFTKSSPTLHKVSLSQVTQVSNAPLSS